MITYKAKQFTLPELSGISAKQVEVHLKLYQGYVTFLNTLESTLIELLKDSEKNMYALSEVKRRLAFEFDGMRMHEYYFEQFEGGSQNLTSGSGLEQALSSQFGSLETAITHFKSVGLMRGIGWTILYYDTNNNAFHIAWVGDHEIGQLSGLPIIIAMDMWEHAYMVDYVPADKKKYIEAFFSNVNWSVCEERFKKLS